MSTPIHHPPAAPTPPLPPPPPPQSSTSSSAAATAAATSLSPASTRSPWLFTKEELVNCPSIRDGLSAQQVSRLRKEGVVLMQRTLRELSLPQLTVATAVVYFNRFYTLRSFNKYPYVLVAEACILLAGKVEETPKCVRDIILATHHVRFKKKEPRPPELTPDSPAFKEERERVLEMEHILLQTLAFDLRVDHSYKYLLSFMREIGATNQLVQPAWNNVNDSLRTTLCLQYRAQSIAAGAIYLTSKLSNYELPTGKDGKKTLWEISETKPEEAEDIAKQICELYETNELQRTSSQQPAGSASPFPSSAVAANASPSSSSSSSQDHQPLTPQQQLLKTPPSSQRTGSGQNGTTDGDGRAATAPKADNSDRDWNRDRDRQRRSLSSERVPPPAGPPLRDRDLRIKDERRDRRDKPY